MLAIFYIISVRYIGRVFVVIRLKDVNVDGIDSEFIFSEVMEYMEDNNIPLVGEFMILFAHRQRGIICIDSVKIFSQK